MIGVADGRCACGETRYSLSKPPMFVHCCHCRYCQRETGASFALNALIEANDIHVIRGKPESIVTPTASGSGQRVLRCPECRIALWSHYNYAGIGELVGFVRVGTLTDPDAFPPNIHIFTESKQHWVKIPGGTKAVEQFYSAKRLWPKVSLKRRTALNKLD